MRQPGYWPGIEVGVSSLTKLQVASLSANKLINVLIVKLGTALILHDIHRNIQIWAFLNNICTSYFENFH